jgi:sphingoid base N-palmitoyltransferase
VRRKDYWATMAHHWVTLMLIVFSYTMGFTKVGLVIMLLHDVCDPFLELAKMGNYASPPRVRFTDAFFVVFTVLWISMRVVYFPIWVIYSVLFYSVDEVAGDANPARFMWVWYGFSSLLILLFLLHLFWTYTILNIALVAVTRGGGAKDSREDDGEEKSQHSR